MAKILMKQKSKVTDNETLYIYARVSTSEQVEKDLSLPRQKELGILKAKELGLSYKIFVEAGESASQENFDNRPQLFQLLGLVKEGHAKHIFVFDQTRLSRNDITKAIISESLKKQKVQLHTHSKRFDFDKQEDVLTFQILEAIETYESSLRKARFQLGYITANKKGRYLKFMPPFGYNKNSEGYLVINGEEKKIFLQIVNLYLNDLYGTNKIANWLNENNIPTKSGQFYKVGYTLKQDVSNRRSSVHKILNKWNPGTINCMLKHELYTGKRRYKTGVNSYDFVQCEPIISKETFDRIQLLRKQNAISKTKECKYFYLLKDLLQCNNCGIAMHGRIKPSRREFTYSCGSKRVAGTVCNGRSINIYKLNKIVWNCFLVSKFYFKAINTFLFLQENIIDTVDGRLAKFQVNHSELFELEKKLLSKQKDLIRRSLDKRIDIKVYEQLIEEIDVKLKTLKNKLTLCLKNIEFLNSQVIQKKDFKTLLKKGFDDFDSTLKQLHNIKFPFKNQAEENKGKKALKELLKNIKVKYIPEKREHCIEVLFQPFITMKYLGTPLTSIQLEDPKKFPIVKQNGGLIKQNHIIQLPIETSKMRLNFTNSLPPLAIVRSQK
jgi:DNA invertase Pin-like site-specific DNA recombinase